MYDSTYMKNLEQSNSQRQKVEQCLPGVGGAGNGVLLFNGNRVSVWYDEKVLEIDDGDGCITM